MPDNKTIQPKYGAQVCLFCNPVKPEECIEILEPDRCPECGQLLYGMRGTEIIDADDVITS